MPDTQSDDGTLSSAMADDGVSALPSQSEQREDGGGDKPAKPSGGEDEGSAPIEGDDDHLHENQKPTDQ